MRMVVAGFFFERNLTRFVCFGVRLPLVGQLPGVERMDLSTTLANNET